jgi:hypothetical protein
LEKTFEGLRCEYKNMQLSPEQIKRFKDLHQNHELDGYTEEEIRDIAHGVGDIYLTLYRVCQRIRREEEAKAAICQTSEADYNKN